MFLRKEKIIGLLLCVAIIIIGVVYFYSQKTIEAVQGGNVGGEISFGNLITDFTTNGPSVGASGTPTSSPYTFTVPLGASGYRTASFQFENMNNATVAFFGSNDTLASSTDFYGANGRAVSSTRTFLNVTNDLIGAANFTSDRMVFLDTPIILQWLRFTVTTSTSATSTIRIKATFSN